MNKKQKIVLWSALPIFLLVTFFPPNSSRSYGSLTTIFEMSGRTIEYGKLFVYWVLIISIAFGLIYGLKDKKPKDD